MGVLLVVLILWTVLQRSLGISLGLGGRLATALVLGLPVAWLSLVYWRRLDEAAREAQLVAGFWGSAIGMGAGMLAVVVGGRAGWDFLGLITAHEEPWRLMFHGATILAAAQIAAVTVCWALWWWRHR
jgi:hypothetical protein